MYSINIKERLETFQTEIRQVRTQMSELENMEYGDQFALLALEEREAYITCIVHYLLSLMLEGSYNSVGIAQWWDRKRSQLGGLMPLQCLDTEEYLKLYDLIISGDNFT